MDGRLITMLAAAALMACTKESGSAKAASADAAAAPRAETDEQVTTLAGGCFWCIESPYENLDGVIEAVSGYMGGHVPDPTYEQVCSGTTGHYEAVQIRFDPRRITYQRLLRVFWMNIDPTDPDGQFADRGSQYRTAIFYHGEYQRTVAEKSRRDLEATGIFDQPIATAVLPAATFYPAEDYHQNYCKVKPDRYERYRQGSGRAGFLERVWSQHSLPWDVGFVMPDPQTLRLQLTDVQCAVTQEDATERAFDNDFWNEKRPGLYVDVVSGQPLFSSADKFKSGTGWPSFTRPVGQESVREEEDRSLGMVRTEVRSGVAGSHLGHVFSDGPGPTGLRYCINSAALRFVPLEELEAEGYGEFRDMVQGR